MPKERGTEIWKVNDSSLSLHNPEYRVNRVFVFSGVHRVVNESSGVILWFRHNSSAHEPIIEYSVVMVFISLQGTSHTVMIHDAVVVGQVQFLAGFSTALNVRASASANNAVWVGGKCRNT